MKFRHATSRRSHPREHWDGSRFDIGGSRGFYESYFQRANHPNRPLAFWIRYTAFSPRNKPDQATGELWAIFFDGEKHRTTAVKESFPVANCAFSRTSLDVTIGEARLTGQGLDGFAASNGESIGWSLRYSGQDSPLLLLREARYDGGFPQAKALVNKPNARFTGRVAVNGVVLSVDDWQGSLNHNWGGRHTDRYSWGQVAGFDNAPSVFLECATAQLKFGPIWSPQVSPVVLRTEDAEFALNGIVRAMRTTARIEFFRWDIDARQADVGIAGFFHASRSDFVALRYPNPPGGETLCLNTKIASAEFTLRITGKPARTLSTRNRAAFEIVTDRIDHGVPVVL